MSSERYYKYAQRESLKSDYKRCHTGCIAVYGGRIVAEGHNSSKTHSLQVKYNHLRGFDPNMFPGTIHAEMAVVQKLKQLDLDYSQVSIYVYRGLDKPRLSRPCKACEAALRDLGIRKVHYTGNDSFITEKYN